LKPLPQFDDYPEIEADEPQVFWTHYDMVQAEVIFLHKGSNYDAAIAPESRLFNEYYGAITFQEIREAQGLAYSVFSSYQNAGKADKSDYIMAYVGTQADKQADAMEAIINLMNNMPESEQNFNTAKDAIISKIESERITRTSILFNYESAKRRNLDYDIRKIIYEKVQDMSMDELKAFHDKYIKDKNYVTLIIGARDKLNFEDLKKYGKINELTLEEIFGYEDVEKIEVGM